MKPKSHDESPLPLWYPVCILCVERGAANCWHQSRDTKSKVSYFVTLCRKCTTLCIMLISWTQTDLHLVICWPVRSATDSMQEVVLSETVSHDLDLIFVSWCCFSLESEHLLAVWRIGYSGSHFYYSIEHALTRTRSHTGHRQHCIIYTGWE